MKNTSIILKTYEFSGFGNYSTDYGWDHGLYCSIGEKTTLSLALSDEDRLREYNGWDYGLPEQPVRGVYYTLNEHGGSRNVYGFVIAKSRRDARSLLDELEELFEFIEYE